MFTTQDVVLATSIVFNVMVILISWATKQQVFDALSPVIFKVNDLSKDIKILKTMFSKDIETVTTDLAVHRNYEHTVQDANIASRYITREEFNQTIQNLVLKSN